MPKRKSRRVEGVERPSTKANVKLVDVAALVSRKNVRRSSATSWGFLSGVKSSTTSRARKRVKHVRES